MSATDELRKMLDERGVEWEDDTPVPSMKPWKTSFTSFTGEEVSLECYDEPKWIMGTLVFHTPEQAIAATLGKQKAKAHPYGYEPDTGAFDTTRCECGCLNDISATYCNDCGGVIEIDMNAEKEIYHTPRHLVFAEKHDDGSLEFGGKRYIAATVGGGKLTAEKVRELIAPHLHASPTFDFGRHGAVWSADFQAIADELNAVLVASSGRGECRMQLRDDIRGHAYQDTYECSGCGEQVLRETFMGESEPPKYCPNCGREVES